MDSAMRDLEQIQERDDAEGRPLALVVLLIVVTVTLVFAMGSLVGWSSEEGELADDPLARLDRAAGLLAEGADDDADEPERAVPTVDRRALTFPAALAPSEDRPELSAALAAASAELAHPDPLAHLPPFEESAEARIARSLPAAVPAAVAVGPGSRTLARAAAHDPLVASSLPAPSAEPPAPVGREGEYTVQVISVPEREAADAFASGLRARGHRAFVVSAELPDRGTTYRVRIGPFETAREAAAYQRTFEIAERMSTLVVRRRE
ncbi:MAG: SPOR domain-containing protein [Sandaracinaceae bacterium]|nr:SPOR domain-containing protein [Sandaracinaceae bacterium]